MTAAIKARFREPAEYLANRQSQHPPRYQYTDGGRALFEGALTFCPSVMQTRFSSGLIAAGEVGDPTPRVYVTRIPGGYAIEIHSGLMRLIYSAARAILATDSGKFRGEVTPAISGTEAAAHIAELFINYREEKIATAQLFPATEHQQRLAHTIAVHAETFLLMHELAHIYNEHSWWLWRPFTPRRSIRELEVQADSTSSRWLIDYLLNPRPNSSQRQMFYAGAEFGLRVRMAMETVEMHFDNTHPAAGDRIQALRARLRSAKDMPTFYAIANTSLAFDQMWRAIERMLRNQPPDIDRTLEDVLASMGSLTAELLRAGNDTLTVEMRQVTGSPGKAEAVFAPKDALRLTLLNSARNHLREVRAEVRDAAREHAGDVYKKGTVEYSLLMGLLSIDPSTSPEPLASVPLPFLRISIEGIKKA